MMKVFNTINNKVEEVEQLSFKLERDIQNLIKYKLNRYKSAIWMKVE